MKGYPKFKAEIVDQSQIQEIQTTVLTGPMAVVMQAYTSDKGTENWELMRGFDNFTKYKGPISFPRHGQALLTVAEVLRAGGVVLGKRMVSDDATLANITIRARVVKVDTTSYIYFYTVSSDNAKVFKEASVAGYKNFNPAKPQVSETDTNIDVPIFTVTPMGRGLSNLRFRINPEYTTNRSSAIYSQYSFEVYEGVELVESTLFTMNHDVIINNESQAMNPKIKSNSNQVTVKYYDEGVIALVNAMAETCTTTEGAKMTAGQVINYDFVYGFDNKGKKKIGGVAYISSATTAGTDPWSTNIPADIKDSIVDLANPIGIPLINGSFGKMTNNPMSNPQELEKMLLASWGANTNSMLFNPVIYDLDAYKVTGTFDCNYPQSVKKQIVNVADFRGDMMFFADLGLNKTELNSIIDEAYNIPNSRNVSIYHNSFNIYDPYTHREINVTMPLLLATRLVQHVESGVIRPFAGLSNNMAFPEIIEGSVNFLPYEIPGINQKSMLVENNINYLNYYDGKLVMDTMYTNNKEYSQLSFVSHVMGVQEIIKHLRSECPKDRYTLIDAEGLDKYIDDIKERLNPYKSQYHTLDVKYMADEKYELNKIFYAVLTVKFRDFFQEEYFKIVAIN